ncbi:hypothetical protein PF005_g30700 [Phytophthora fragariae]|uniref:Ig-like domain-containing protein n=1 Tax=Phytophthora fragariae TaxID=53985 RepID=A0A6A3VKU9_9STRA|nr:hypothetical protein PF009_g30924 [Phytophthora fragariae]KAE9061381.1 hypothetical protein PF007_g30273 [Phytophthora fragariae]KAE9162824.1 hypothetical protein PF005_g30700 [Phytophthora fragariae]
MVIASIQVAVLTAALVAAAANAHSKMSLPKPTRSAVQHDSLYGTATIECGFSWTNGTARDLLPDEVQWDKLTTGHDGPCEIWCDETLVFSDQNCAVNYPDSPASFSYDKAACEGKSSSDSTTSTSTTTSAPTTSSTATTAPSPTTASPSSTEASNGDDCGLYFCGDSHLGGDGGSTSYNDNDGGQVFASSELRQSSRLLAPHYRSEIPGQDENLNSILFSKQLHI